MKKNYFGAVFYIFLVLSFFVLGDNYGEVAVARAQDLFANKLQKIPSIKRGNYFNEGAIFYEGKNSGKGKTNRVQVKSLRHFYSKQKKEERIVLDFNSGDYLPKIYGYVANKQKKIYIDMFDTDLNSNIAGWGSGQLLSDVFFLPVDGESISVELGFATPFTVDVFYLDNPSRLVLDVKESAVAR